MRCALQDRLKRLAGTWCCYHPKVMEERGIPAAVDYVLRPRRDATRAAMLRLAVADGPATGATANIESTAATADTSTSAAGGGAAVSQAAASATAGEATDVGLASDLDVEIVENPDSAGGDAAAGGSVRMSKGGQQSARARAGAVAKSGDYGDEAVSVERTR